VERSVMAEGFFWGNDPNVNQQLRQRIAMAMLSQKKGYPKTFGEGLTSVGDAIGDIGMMRRLEQGDVAAQAAGKAAVDKYSSPSAAPPTGYAPPDSIAPASAAIDNAIAPAAAAAPAATLTPQETADGVSDGGYNVLDAQAGFKRQGDGRLQDVIASKESNPDMQAYYGSLSSGERRGPGDVSPTGAKGPWQFTNGTVPTVWPQWARLR
jgi:hypothetical protein